METCLIGLGSNLGNRRETLDKAIALIKVTPGVYNVEASRFRETKPVGGPVGQPAFLNAAVTCRASVSPEVMLERLQAIENNLGRVREVRWDARTLDLDLLLFGVRRFESERLTIPHPRLATRRFVLDPAVALAGNWLHPALGTTLNSLHSRMVDARGECWLVFPTTRQSDAETIASACRDALLNRPLALKAIDDDEVDLIHRTGRLTQQVESGRPWMTIVLAATTNVDRWTKAAKHLMRTGRLGPAVYLTSDDPLIAAAEAVAAIGSALGL